VPALYVKPVSTFPLLLFCVTDTLTVFQPSWRKYLVPLPVPLIIAVVIPVNPLPLPTNFVAVMVPVEGWIWILLFLFAEVVIEAVSTLVLLSENNNGKVSVLELSSAYVTFVLVSVQGTSTYALLLESSTTG
jgi:hypothetical protein